MKYLLMPTWLAVVTLCLLCSFTLPQMADLNTSAIIVEGDVMIVDSDNADFDIMQAKSIRPTCEPICP